MVGGSASGLMMPEYSVVVMGTRGWGPALGSLEEGPASCKATGESHQSPAAHGGAPGLQRLGPWADLEFPVGARGSANGQRSHSPFPQ